MLDTTEAKIIIDMPLPMPRWLISSPIHISTAVPATSVGMTMYARGQMPSGSRGRQARGGRREKAGASTGAEHEHEAGGLQRGQGDRDVAGVLRDLALPDRALLLELLQLGDHHAEDLHDDARGDVRHDPEGEDREALERRRRRTG